MNGPSIDYSTKKISKILLREIISCLQSVSNYGSVEVMVQDNVVTQITVRNIKKTNHTNSNGLTKVNNGKSFVNKL